MSEAKRFTGILVVLLVLQGCASSSPTIVKEREFGTAVDAKGKVIGTLSCTKNSGIKITIGKVLCKAAGCKARGTSQKSGLFALLQLAGVPSFEGIGDGLKDMFMSSLQRVLCFKVLDREAMAEIQRELEFAGVTTNAKMESADYIVMASITSVDFQRNSGSLGGGFIPLVSIISKTKQKATLDMDVRIVDVKSGEVVYSNVYNAESGKTSYGVGGFGGVGGLGFGGALSGLSGTAMEEVARDIIVKATYDIVEHLVPVDMVTRAHNTSES